jgi:hypothetical protein
MRSSQASAGGVGAVSPRDTRATVGASQASAGSVGAVGAQAGAGSVGAGSPVISVTVEARVKLVCCIRVMRTVVG